MDGSILILSLLKLKESSKDEVFNFIKNKGFDSRKCSEEINSYINEEQFNEFRKTICSATNELTFGMLNKVNCVTIFDDDFNPLFYNTMRNPCLYLYTKGDTSILKTKTISILGDNNISQGTLEDSFNLGVEIARSGMTLVTDLALGVNNEAIKGVLSEGGKVIIVISNDINDIKPVEYDELANKVLQYGGLLVTEYPIGYPYSYDNRTRKYELISLLSNLLVIVNGSETHESYVSVKKSIEDHKLVLASKDAQIGIVTNYINIKDLIGEQLIDLYDGNLKEIKGEQLTLF